MGKVAPGFTGVITGSFANAFADISEYWERGVLVLRLKNVQPKRRVLYINSYGGPAVWDKVKRGEMPSQHLWGCLELVRYGYEVALADALTHFSYRRHPLPHDLIYVRAVREWLGAEGIVYSAHTLLFWLPLLRLVGRIKSPIVSLTYAREELDWARLHSGIVAMTPAAVAQARKVAPKVKCLHGGWGVDLNYFPQLEYRPDSLLSCGITRRDFKTLSVAASQTNHSIRVICPGLPEDITWSPNVTITDSGQGYNFQNKAVSYRELLTEYYGRCTALLVIVQEDAREYTANGFTNVLEGMAMGRPIIMTRTGAVPAEVDLEAHGCGLFVPPGNAAALAAAIDWVASNPSRAAEMGAAGRRLCEERYNIKCFGDQLHQFFSEL